VESKCTSFTNLKDEHEALSGYSGSVSPCAGSSMSAKNEANDSIGIQAEFLPPTLTPGNLKLLIAFYHFSALSQSLTFHGCIAQYSKSQIPTIACM
jgi:hypothetical protein